MPLDELLRLCRAFEAAGLAFWIDDGWGVDVLLGEQTRLQSDLDLAVLRSDLYAFGKVLEAVSYRRNDRPGDPDWNWGCSEVRMAGPSTCTASSWMIAGMAYSASRQTAACIRWGRWTEQEPLEGSR